MAIKVGFCSETGRRESNEDAHLSIVGLPSAPASALFAIFGKTKNGAIYVKLFFCSLDGHGGKKASRFCEKNFCSLLEKSKAYGKGFFFQQKKTIEISVLFNAFLDMQEALKQTFIKVDAKFAEKIEDDGTTAVKKKEENPKITLNNLV